MHFLYEDSPREVVLESALHIGAAEGDEAITLESVAKLAELSVAKVRSLAGRLVAQPYLGPDL